MTTTKKEMAALLVRISEWCLEHRLGSGIFRDTPDGADEVEDSIFINGNLARVLICTYEITGEESYLREAVSWCDYFVDTANPIKTSKGNDPVWWWDVGHNNLYLADTGTAVHALFKAFPYVDDDRKQKYLNALKKFYLLLAEGAEQVLVGFQFQVCQKPVRCLRGAEVVQRRTIGRPVLDGSQYAFAGCHGLSDTVSLKTIRSTLRFVLRRETIRSALRFVWGNAGATALRCGGFFQGNGDPVPLSGSAQGH